VGAQIWFAPEAIRWRLERETPAARLPVMGLPV
jgi:hypothetical protein